MALSLSARYDLTTMERSMEKKESEKDPEGSEVSPEQDKFNLDRWKAEEEHKFKVSQAKEELEFKRWQAEEDLKLKREELNIKRQELARAKLSSPLLLAIIGLFFSIVLNIVQNYLQS